MAKRLYKLGALAQDHRTGLKMLFKAVAKDDFDTLQYPLGTNYVVPANKTLYISMVWFIGDTARTIMRVLYGDDVVTASAVPPTNPVYISPFYQILVSGEDHHHETLMEVPEGKYPAVEFQVGSGSAEIQGIEI